MLITGLLGIVRLGGIYRTGDWLCISAVFTFMVPFGVHMSLFFTVLGFTLSVLNHMMVCLATNMASRDPFPDVQASRMAMFMAWLSCKRRTSIDRFAYPAVLDNYNYDENGGRKYVFDINSGMMGKKLDLEKKCPYVIPSIPVLTLFLASLLAVIFVMFPQSIMDALSW